MLEFSLPTNDIPLSGIFSHLEDAKSILQLQDYSVSQTTLDQVFVSFASLQNNDCHSYSDGSSDQSSLGKTSAIDKETVDAPPVNLHASGNTNAAFDADLDHASLHIPTLPSHEPEPDYLYQQVSTDHDPKPGLTPTRHHTHRPFPACTNSNPLLPRGCQTTRPKRQVSQAVTNFASCSNYATLGVRPFATSSSAIPAPRPPTYSYSFTPNHHLYGYPAAYAAYAAGWNSQPPPPLTYATLGSRLPVAMTSLSPMAPSHIPRTVDPSQRTKRKKR
jgi:hypothetical protein